MKHKKWLIIYAAAMLCVAIWLGFSNQIVLAFSGIESVEKCERELTSWGTATLYGSIGDFYIANDLHESITVSGWAFAATTEENVDRKTYLIFQGDSASYQYEIKIPEGKDTLFYDMFIYRGPAITALLGLDNPNPALGFAGEFSTLGMADGEYELYLACWETETTSGVKGTGIHIRKMGATVERIDKAPEETVKLISEEKTVTQDERCASCLDLAQAQGDTVKISGWAFVKGLDSTKQVLYLECLNENGQNQCYGTSQYDRPGFVELFDDANCGYAGFDACLPLAAINEDGQRVRILLENEGEIWSSITYTISKSDEGFMIEQ